MKNDVNGISFNFCRQKLLATLQSAVDGDGARHHHVVYDLDTEPEALQKNASAEEALRVTDISLTQTAVSGRTLNFESRFESGNLRRALQVRILLRF